MRVSSFDVFDTLLTRLVAQPHDIFLELGTQLNQEGLVSCFSSEFAVSRIRAEKVAYKRFGRSDVSLAEIYTVLAEQMGWDHVRSAAALDWEIAIEQKNIRVFPDSLRRVAEARAESDQIVFISDMYLPPDLIRSLLERDRLFLPGDRLFVSNPTAGSKASGTLYQFIRKEFASPIEWRHFGDNPDSDYRRAQQSGIKAELITDCALSRYEKIFRQPGNSMGPLWRSRVAGAMRFARLTGSNLATPAERTIWNTGTQIAGPLLFGFVAWLLRQATERNIKRLYFIARDGQILHRLAKVISLKSGIEIESRYLFGSRQPWLLGALGQFDDRARQWILPSSDQATLATAFTRAGLNPKRFINELDQAGFPANSWNQILDWSYRDRLWTFLTQSTIAEEFRETSKIARRNLYQYLAQEQFFDGTSSAIVDIGWRGNLQKSLRRVIDLTDNTNKTRVNGFYLGLVDHLEIPEGDFAAAYWPMQQTANPFRKNNLTLLEAFTAADHGTVIGYQNEAGNVTPVLQHERNDGAIKWGLSVLHESVLAFANLLVAQLPLVELPMDDYFQCSRRAYELFISQPERAEALVWGSFPFGSQANEITEDILVTHWTEWRNLAALFNHSKRPTAWWLEGTLKCRFSPSIYLFLMARRFQDKVRNFKSNGCFNQ